MRREITTTELRWIDIVDPDSGDLRFLREELQFHPLDVDECSRPSLRPKVESHQEYLFLVVHVPRHLREERATLPAEYDVFIRPGALVTVHSSRTQYLESLFVEAGADAAVRERTVGRGTAFLLYRILDHLFETAFPMLDHIVEHLDRADARIFSGHERQMVGELSAIRRDLAGFRSIVRPQRHLYESGTLQGNWMSPAFSIVFRSVHGKLTRLWDHLETLWERADALAETNAVLVNNKLNEFVKMVTVLGALFIPFGLIAQVVPVLHDGVPLVNRLIFWGIIAAMLVVDFVLLWRARHRGVL